jgi:hypothetical protein
LHPEIKDEVVFKAKEGLSYYHGDIKKRAIVALKLLNQNVKKYVSKIILNVNNSDYKQEIEILNWRDFLM